MSMTEPEHGHHQGHTHGTKEATKPAHVGVEEEHHTHHHEGKAQQDKNRIDPTHAEAAKKAHQGPKEGGETGHLAVPAKKEDEASTCGVRKSLNHDSKQGNSLDNSFNPASMRYDPLPPDTKPHRTCLSPSHSRKRSSQLKVRWGPKVIFNEHKYGSLVKKKWDQSPLSTIAAAKLEPAHPKRPDQTNADPSEKAQTNKKQTTKEVPKRDPPKKEAQKQESAKREPATHMRKAPPAVPDPPRREERRPPPAPRPARLPTPDLPEIDASKMFPGVRYVDPRRGRYVDQEGESDPLRRPTESKARPAKSKANDIVEKIESQLEAAKAYMRENKMKEDIARRVFGS